MRQSGGIHFSKEKTVMNIRAILVLSALAIFASPSAFACGDKAAHASGKASCGHSFVMQANAAEKSALPAGMAAAVFAVEGMTCSSCEAHITSSLKKIEGVADVAFNRKKGLVTVTYALEKLKEPAALLAGFEGAGYKATIAPEAKAEKNAPKGA